MTKASNIQQYLKQVDNAFGIKTILNQDIDDQSVVDYYTQSDYGYRIFHSTDGSVHMALNDNGTFDPAGYYGQARMVEQYIHQLQSQWILELASGKGFNSRYLADHHPDNCFTGIDLTPQHVRIAQNVARTTPNLTFQIGNFQHLPFASEQFGVVFVVESFCHASNMHQALVEAFRVLQSGGYFVIFDGFRKPNFYQLDTDIQVASQLVEASMAVKHPWILEQWLTLAQEVGFLVERVEDLSEAIMPNLRRFEWMANKYFKYPIVSRTLMHMAPPHLLRNAVAGLLMPTTLRAGAHSYNAVVLTRS